MGRVKIQLKKIEPKNYRHISFAKRKDGLVKKAYELSTLCDVEVALIIFSPAGKLILFDGKRRIEETIKRYIDLPQHQRGRLANQEMIQRLATQMSMEADLWHQLSSSGDKDRKMIDIQLEQIQNQISLRNVELEDVEKQLEYFVKSPTSIKSITSAECHESILEDALRRLSLRKQVLKEKLCSETASQTLNPQTTTPTTTTTTTTTTFMMGSPSYGLRWPQQHEHVQTLATNFTNSTGFQPERNESEPSAEIFPSSMAVCGTAGYLAGTVVTGDSDNGQSSMAFHGLGYQAGHAVHSGSNQFAPSMELYGTGYQAGNAVHVGSNQLAPSMGFHCTGYQAGTAVHAGSNQLAPSMGFQGTGYQAGNAIPGGSNQLAPSMGFHGTGYQAGHAVHGGSNQLATSMQFYGAGYLTGNAVNNGSDQFRNGFFSPSEYGRFLNGNLAPSINNMQQGMRTTPMTPGPSQVVGNVARASHGSSSLHGFSDLPFPY